MKLKVGYVVEIGNYEERAVGYIRQDWKHDIDNVSHLIYLDNLIWSDTRKWGWFRLPVEELKDVKVLCTRYRQLNRKGELIDWYAYKPRVNKKKEKKNA